MSEARLAPPSNFNSDALSANVRILVLDYAADGAAVHICEQAVLGWWLTDATTPAAPMTVERLPNAVGGLPQWVQIIDGPVIAAYVVVPDLWRGQFVDFLSWLATYNGVRTLSAEFFSNRLRAHFDEWSRRNPGGAAPAPEMARRGPLLGWRR